MISNTKRIISPSELNNIIPNPFEKNVDIHREEIKNIVDGNDKRKLIIVGPCSIHDPIAAIEYGKRLVELRKRCPNLYIVMRVYFEKPRTTVGWKGFVNDPLMNNTFNIDLGLRRARNLCIELLKMGLPLATEVLDPFTIRYMRGIFSWVAIGARTTESQTHREIASGLPMAVGFKNGTTGDVDVAINAIESAKHNHTYMGIDDDGQISQISASGNKHGHVILRGGTRGSNAGINSVNCVYSFVKKPVMVDCSHANCGGDYRSQETIGIKIIDDMIENKCIDNLLGLMIESNLNEGKQCISENMKYGVSITDACINIDVTENMLIHIDEKLGTK